MKVFSLAGLALAGLAISIYFTLAYYGRIRNARWVPAALCAREESSCVAVLRSRYARLFGVPNSLLGTVFYLAVIGWVMAGLEFQLPESGVGASLFMLALFAKSLLVASGATVIVGFYLIFALRWRLRIRCPLCYAAHAINLGIFLLLCV